MQHKNSHPIPLSVAVHVVIELLQGGVGDVVARIAPRLIDGRDHLVKGWKFVHAATVGYHDDVGLTEGLGTVLGTYWHADNSHVK